MQFKPLGRTHESIPVVGLGTWGIGGEMGPDSSRDEAGIEALRLGLDLEMKFIDTAEMYGAGQREKVVSNQVEFSLIDRSVEARILPYCQKEGLTLIAYSPLGQGKIPRGQGSSFKVLDEIAGKLGKSRNQVALNWVLQHDSVVAIPKAADTDHVKENAEVADWKLDSEDYQRLAKVFS